VKTPVTDAGAYTDVSGLAALKKAAAAHDPAAVRAAAKQFESVFTRMMIKSMRDANFSDPVFGSDQTKFYEGMFDDQLSMEMTKGHGLGLADVLVRQLQQQAGAASASSAASAANVPTAANDAVPPAKQADFVKDHWPAAVDAGEKLGVDPRNLLAQAALETHWGTQSPRDASGAPTHNLFGIKAATGWDGGSAASPTREHLEGRDVSTTAAFRAYPSPAASFQDYVTLLRGSPRYAAALNTGGNTEAFAQALQRGGYSTDPDYASKVVAVARTLADLAPPLKFAAAVPMNDGTRTL
jgi:flagellar protein FlgJ